MASIRSTDTRPEIVVRKIVHRLGFRFRLHRADLPGKPDLVFPRLRKVIFVQGCYWHQHHCGGGTMPKRNREYWEPKLRTNVARDVTNQARLIERGWRVMEVWECELKDTRSLEARLRSFLTDQPVGPS